MDHFAVFQLVPQPWLDLDSLKDHYLRLSVISHPDKASPENKATAEADFTSLTESYNILRNTRQRLLHLLELRGIRDRAHVQRVPPAALEFFTPIANITALAEDVLKEKARAHSPMLQVSCFGRALEITDSLQTLQEQLAQRIRAIELKVQDCSKQWVEGASEPITEIQDAATALGFLERWSAQIQRLLAALAF
jgi:DnaJ-domain-containing protein 1